MGRRRLGRRGGGGGGRWRDGPRARWGEGAGAAGQQGPGQRGARGAGQWTRRTPDVQQGRSCPAQAPANGPPFLASDSSLSKPEGGLLPRDLRLSRLRPQGVSGPETSVCICLCIRQYQQQLFSLLTVENTDIPPASWHPSEFLHISSDKHITRKRPPPTPHLGSRKLSHHTPALCPSGRAPVLHDITSPAKSRSLITCAHFTSPRPDIHCSSAFLCQ